MNLNENTVEEEEGKNGNIEKSPRKSSLVKQFGTTGYNDNISSPFK